MFSILAITSPIYILLGIGYLGARFHLVPSVGRQAMGTFVINLALPALIFRSLSQRSFHDIFRLDYLAAYGLGSVAMMTIGILQSYLPPRRGLREGALMSMGMSVTNSVFVGFPIVQMLIGPGASIALALTQIIENIVILPITIGLAEAGGQIHHSRIAILRGVITRVITHPIVIAIVAAVIASLIQLKLPAPIGRALDLLGAASVACALFVIGGALMGMNISGMKSDILRISCGKLLLHPLVMGLAVMLFPSIPPSLKLAAVMYAAAPMLSIYPILCQRYGWEDTGAATLLVATVMSFFTINAILWLFKSGLVGL